MLLVGCCFYYFQQYQISRFGTGFVDPWPVPNPWNWELSLKVTFNMEPYVHVLEENKQSWVRLDFYKGYLLLEQSWF